MSDVAEGADEVDLYRQFELLHRIEFRRFGLLVARHGLGRVGDAGAIDQNPLLAMRPPCLGEGRGDLLVGGHVDLAEDSADLLGDFVSAFCIAVEHGDLGASCRQRARGRLAQP
jgi:hypothetical protein